MSIPGIERRDIRADLLSRAVARQQAKDFTAAEELYRRFLRAHPTHLVALNNAGLVAKALGKYDVALMRLSKATRRYPNAPETQFNLANTLQEMHRLEEAIAAYRRAIALNPGYAKAHLNLGNALDKLRRYEEAVACYQQALASGGAAFERSKEGSEAYCNLGSCLKEQGRLIDALVHFTCATRIDPDRADFHFAVGVTQYGLRHHDDAIISFRRVLEIDPKHEGARSTLMFQTQFICDWPEVAALAPAVRAGVDAAFAAGKPCSEGALDCLTRDVDPIRNHAVARSSASVFETDVKLYRPKPPVKGSTPDRINLGYLSADFRDHPVSQVMGGVFSRHDREKFHVTGYSYGPDDGSSWRQRIAADCDRFVDLQRVTDDTLARRIRDDGIDILIDLTLWTQGCRPRICALRPAALQIQYLGFPGTSGADWYDYAIVDRTVVPPDERATWSESLIYMPECFFVTDRDQPISNIGMTRPDLGLPKTGVVFCSFNQNFKIDAIVFNAWMQILTEVPDSVLWLPESAHSEDNLRREVVHAGVAPERLIFARRTLDKAQHLERLALADIALDTLNYNGHTTTSDALWAGVPTIAMMGQHFASRVSASLLKAVGLDQLIVRNVDEYVALAANLAKAPSERARLRAHLAAARTHAPLFDTDRTVASLEQAYQAAWQRFIAGSPAAEIHL